MSDVAVEILGLRELMQEVNELIAFKVVRDTMEVAVERVRTQIAVYPSPPSSGYHMVFKSDKQRRFFFAALRDGRITVPYRRTGTLGRRWTTSVSNSGLDIRGEVGNVTNYGPFVQSAESQAPIHQGRWRTAERVVEEMEPQIQDLFESRIQAAMP